MLTSLALYLIVSPAWAFDWTWRDGRATFYGLDGWNIMKGSCEYGQLGLQEVSRLCNVFADRGIGGIGPDLITCLHCALSAPWMGRGRLG